MESRIIRDHITYVISLVFCFMCQLSAVSCQLPAVTCHLSPVTCHLSPVTCHLSLVTCHLSPVNCHLSLTPLATATYPPPANSSIVNSRLVSKTQIPQKISKCKKSLKRHKPKNVYRYANVNNVLFEQKSPVHRQTWFPQRHTHTDKQLKDIAT